jgi:hypothetical protein
VNEVDDAHAKMATSFKPPEITFFRLLVNAVMDFEI